MSKVKHAIILAGGMGTRLAEQTHAIPKPLVEVGGVPILVHVINHLVHHGAEHIVIAGGYKVDLIKEYFMSDRYRYRGSISLTEDGVENHDHVLPRGLKSLVVADTGLTTGTAQRIKRAAEYLPDDNVPFFMTYGDGVSDVDLGKVVDLYNDTGAKLVLTAVQYQERFGVIKMGKESESKVDEFAEKSMSTDTFINGGFMVLDSAVLDVIEEDDFDFSKETMPRLQEAGEIHAYKHLGFWDAMDTQKDYENLNKLYDENPELFIRSVR